MDVIENHDYHELLLLYRGDRSFDALQARLEQASDVGSATLAYGMANWKLYNGERDEAIERFRTIVAGPAWPSFGHMAAEAELARIAGED